MNLSELQFYLAGCDRPICFIMKTQLKDVPTFIFISLTVAEIKAISEKRAVYSLSPQLLPAVSRRKYIFASWADQNGPRFLFCFKIEGDFPPDANDLGCSLSFLLKRELLIVCTWVWPSKPVSKREETLFHLTPNKNDGWPFPQGFTLLVPTDPVQLGGSLQSSNTANLFRKETCLGCENG